MKLLAGTALTYERALTVSQVLETATKNLQEMKTPTSTTTTVKSEPVSNVGSKGKKPAGKEEGSAEVTELYPGLSFSSA